MKKAVMITTLLMATLTLTSQAYANLGGPGYGNIYSRGTYDCEDQKMELQGHFTYGSGKATLTIKGQPTSLSCDSARNADLDVLAFFRAKYLTPVEVCTGQSPKGDVLVALTNGMGNTQMSAYLLDSAGRVKAESRLNCESAPASNNSGW